MPVEWVDPDDLVAVAGLARSADFNTVLDNLKYLYDPPRCCVRLTGTQEVANASDHTIEWDEAVWDSHGDMWDAGAPSVVTITRAGIYAIQPATLWATSADAGKRAIFLQVSGTRRRGIQVPAVSPSELVLPVLTNLEDGDYIDVDVRQLSGGPLDLQSTRTLMTVMWVAAPPVSGE